MAKGTASVEPAGGAEKAAAAKPEAFEPETSGNLVQQGAGGGGAGMAGNKCEGHHKARPCVMINLKISFSLAPQEVPL